MAAEHNFEIGSDLRGYMEVTVASKADRIAFRGNMHIFIRVIYASDFKFEAQFAVRDHQDHHYNSRVLRAIALLYE